MKNLISYFLCKFNFPQNIIQNNNFLTIFTLNSISNCYKLNPITLSNLSHIVYICFLQNKQEMTLIFLIIIKMIDFFQKTLIDSIHKEDESFDADGYISLAIIYAVLSVCNWGAPSTISIIGPKFSMLIGAVTYLLV